MNRRIYRPSTFWLEWGLQGMCSAAEGALSSACADQAIRVVTLILQLRVGPAITFEPCTGNQCLLTQGASSSDPVIETTGFFTQIDGIPPAGT